MKTLHIFQFTPDSFEMAEYGGQEIKLTQQVDQMINLASYLPDYYLGLEKLVIINLIGTSYYEEIYTTEVDSENSSAYTQKYEKVCSINVFSKLKVGQSFICTLKYERWHFTEKCFHLYTKLRKSMLKEQIEQTGDEPIFSYVHQSTRDDTSLRNASICTPNQEKVC